MIRKALEGDSRIIAEIIVLGWQEAYKDIISKDFLDRLNIEQKEEKIRQQIADVVTNIIVYEDGNRGVVGFCKFGYEANEENDEDEETNCDCELYAIYVLPCMKGNGIGTKLINFLKEKCISENKKSICLWCLKDNINGRNFYEKKNGILYKERTEVIGKENIKMVSYLFSL